MDEVLSGAPSHPLPSPLDPDLCPREGQGWAGRSAWSLQVDCQWLLETSLFPPRLLHLLCNFKTLSVC